MDGIHARSAFETPSHPEGAAPIAIGSRKRIIIKLPKKRNRSRDDELEDEITADLDQVKQRNKRRKIDQPATDSSKFDLTLSTIAQKHSTSPSSCNTISAVSSSSSVSSQESCATLSVIEKLGQDYLMVERARSDPTDQWYTEQQWLEKAMHRTLCANELPRVMKGLGYEVLSDEENELENCNCCTEHAQ